ncbi:helix-turn-helix domain-containing protein [Gordonia sp. PDNC005]|uniref:PucR family transcriptional regulator n=1 Tax=unclassified Gordonia (in: high G+C Gram-positive bacteria) TaxID=2657482 RepID=UPI00196460CB|nr:helix-turn-helix domain-containing protein [Gordonia sp. PDNC005]QRY61598.1 helix-turn-helix domain-containing protein [Gordonia sp. PDNC005]
MDVSAVMRPFVEAVWNDRDDLVRAVAATVTTRLVSYGASPSSEVWIGMNRILERSILGDSFGVPTEADRDAAYGTGVQGAAAGIATEDLTAAVLLGARVVEASVMERAAQAGVDAETRLEAMVRARAWAEQIAVWAAEGLGKAARRAADADQAAAELLTALRERRDPGLIRALGDRAGVDLSARWFAVVARSAGGGFVVDAATLRFSHSGAGVWVGEQDVLVGLVNSRPRPVGALVIGSSRPGTLSDLADALSDAERACRVAVKLSGPGVHSLDDLGLLVPMFEDPLLGERLRRRWLDPLRADDRHDLVDTVRQWQGSGWSIDGAGRRLSVHPNTVRNRLSRVDALLGGGWRAPSAQAEIWAALATVGSTVDG